MSGLLSATVSSMTGQPCWKPRILNETIILSVISPSRAAIAGVVFYHDGVICPRRYMVIGGSSSSWTADSFHDCLRIHQSGVIIGNDSVDISDTSTTVVVSISVVDGLDSTATVLETWIRLRLSSLVGSLKNQSEMEIESGQMAGFKNLCRSSLQMQTHRDDGVAWHQSMTELN